MTIDTKALKTYAKAGLNVIMTGKHGVGKTAVIKKVFEEVFGAHREKWMYFSASTLDPWVDVIGIPKNYTRPDGKEVFGIIPPEHFSGDEEIEAVFFDEINRADPKTLNALMEMIQFKSINGRKFPHLKVVWAAENPDDDADAQYSTRPLDPAQKDRFQIQLNFPNVLNKDYFEKKYGAETFLHVKEWWEPNKDKCSPRKLDDILAGYFRGFNILDFSTSIQTLNELQFVLDTMGNLEEMKQVSASGDRDMIRSYFTLDKLRTNEKLLKKDRKKQVLKNIIVHVNEEIQEYITKEYGLHPNTVAAGDLGMGQDALVGQWQTRRTLKFASYNTSGLLEVMRDFAAEFEPQTVKNKDCLKVIYGQPMKFPMGLASKYIQDMVRSWEKESDGQQIVQNWFITNLFMLNQATDVDFRTEMEIHKILDRLITNRMMVSFLKLNKIFVKEVLTYKKRFSIEEFTRRVLTDK
ncbi:MAG: MoxR family ATPase [Anaerolineaceae bacterium]